MNVFILMFAVVSSCAAFDFSMNIRSHVEECAKANNVDMSTIKFGQPIDPKLAKTRPYKCFGQCVSVKAGFSNEAGDLNRDKIKQLMPMNNDGVEKIMECARENKQSDKCNRSYAVYECVRKRVKGVIPE